MTLLINQLKFPAGSGVVFYVGRNADHPTDPNRVVYGAMYPNGKEFRVSDANYLALKEAYEQISCSKTFFHDTHEVRWFIYDTDLKEGFVCLGNKLSTSRANSYPRRAGDIYYTYKQADRDIGFSCVLPPAKSNLYRVLMSNSDVGLVGGEIVVPTGKTLRSEWTRLTPELFGGSREEDVPALGYLINFGPTGIEFTPLWKNESERNAHRVAVINRVLLEVGYLSPADEYGAAPQGSYLLRITREPELSPMVRFHLLKIHGEPKVISYKDLINYRHAQGTDKKEPKA